MPESRILLIDDSPDIAALMLRSRDYQMSVALDGLKGTERNPNGAGGAIHADPYLVAYLRYQADCCNGTPLAI